MKLEQKTMTAAALLSKLRTYERVAAWVSVTPEKGKFFDITKAQLRDFLKAQDPLKELQVMERIGEWDWQDQKQSYRELYVGL